MQRLPSMTLHTTSSQTKNISWKLCLLLKNAEEEEAFKEDNKKESNREHMHELQMKRKSPEAKREAFC